MLWVQGQIRSDLMHLMLGRDRALMHLMSGSVAAIAMARQYLDHNHHQRRPSSNTATSQRLHPQFPGHTTVNNAKKNDPVSLTSENPNDVYRLCLR